MHLIFHIPELLESICAKAAPASLASLAQTSNHLFLPAVKELYRKSNEKQFLAIHKRYQRTLDAKGITVPAAAATAVRRRRQVSAVVDAASERAGFYAGLIKHLDLSSIKPLLEKFDANDSSALAVTLSAMVLTCRAVPLFHSLQSLVFRPQETYHRGILGLLLTGCNTSLHSLTVALTASRSEDSVEYLVQIFRLLPSASPNLRTLVLEGNDAHPERLVPVLRTVILSLAHLQHLSAMPDYVVPDLITDLAQRVDMRVLHLENTRFWYTSSQSIVWKNLALPPDAFSALEDLALTLPFQDALRFMEAISLSQLVKLRLAAYAFVPDVFQQEFDRFTKQLMRTERLQDFDLSMSGRMPGINLRTIWSSILPITMCRSISRFSVVLEDNTTPPSDEIIDSFSAAWPCLHYLSLRWDTPSKVRKGPTLQALHRLSTRCPRLDYIYLQSLYAPANLTLPSSTLPRKLCLFVPHPSFEDMDEAAVFFAKAWSSVTILHLSDPRPKPTRSNRSNRFSIEFDDIEFDDIDVDITHPDSPWKKLLSKIKTIRRFVALEHMEDSLVYRRHVDDKLQAYSKDGCSV